MILARLEMEQKEARLRVKLRRAKAEEEGFEPPVPLGTPVFPNHRAIAGEGPLRGKTGAFNRSATPPDYIIPLLLRNW